MVRRRIQSNAEGETYSSEPEKMLNTKSDAVIAGLIRGMRDPERVQAYIEAEAEGQARKNVIAALNRKKKELEIE